MNSYTITYGKGHMPGTYTTTIDADNEDQARDKFYKLHPNYVIYDCAKG